jgi:ketosteroid isomerase-like protein
MSEANVAWIRAQNEVFNRGDLEAWAEAFGSDHEWVTVREHPQASIHKGPEALRAYIGDWHEMMGDMQVDEGEIIDAGEQVAMIGRVRGRGTGSGAEVEVVVAFVTTFRDERPIRTEEFLDPAEARRAVGIASA